jgi:hypothetical protein
MINPLPIPVPIPIPMFVWSERDGITNRSATQRQKESLTDDFVGCGSGIGFGIEPEFSATTD